MDCHRCQNVRYDGCPYGRCSHPGHQDVRLAKPGSAGREDGSRTYNRQICPDFRMKKRCSNCRYWDRGRYFSDGMTPAKKGKCSLRLSKTGPACPMWAKGKTSWRKSDRDK